MNRMTSPLRAIAVLFIILAILFYPVNTLPAYAAATIDTSVDTHGNLFFGDSLVQVLIEDDSASGSSTVSNTVILPSIEVRDKNGLLIETASPSIPDTSDGSQRFEFFLLKEGSTIEPRDPDADDVTLLEIGPGSDINIDSELDEGFTIKIIHKDATTTITYDDQTAAVSADKNEYGIGETVILTITDQDANADPTRKDVIESVSIDDEGFFSITGAIDFSDDIVYVETGQNTARFEGLYVIGSEGGDEGDITVNPDAATTAISFSFLDASEYMTDSDSNGRIDEADTPAITLESASTEISISIEEVVNLLATLTDPTLSSELSIPLDAPDRNTASQDENTIESTVSDDFDNPAADDLDIEDPDNSGVIVYVDADGGDIEAVGMKETGDNTAKFVPDFAGNKLKVTFLAEGELPEKNNGQLEFSFETITEDIKVLYIDDVPNPADKEVSSTTLELVTQPGTLDVPETAALNSDFVLTITDRDLNNNEDIKDIYTIRLEGDGDENNEFGLFRAGDPIGNFATIEILIGNLHPTFEILRSYNLVETGVNTGNFTTAIDINDIVTSTGLDLHDGDRLEFSYHDYMEPSGAESGKTLLIGIEETSIELSRTTLPIPPALDSATADFADDTVTTTLTVTDPNENERSASNERIPLRFDEDAEDDEPSFIFRIEGDGIEETITGLGAAGDFDPSTYEESILQEIMPKLPDLVETGNATGVFNAKLEFVSGTLDAEDWNSLEITITYLDATEIEPEEKRTGLVFLGHSGSLSVSSKTASLGDDLVVTIQDEDLNFDDSRIESFRAQTSTDDDFLLAVETENEELDDENEELFTETGPNTGVFTANYTIGLDIPITDQNKDDEIIQATKIVITYNDEISSFIGEREISEQVSIIKQTAVINVSPEAAGPGVTIQVTIADSDLNLNPKGVDTVDPQEDIVLFRTDRREAGEASPKLRETGANTGIFQFELKLVPLTRDQLKGDEEIDEAQGGSEPEIGVSPGDTLLIRYEDQLDAEGELSIVSKAIEVKSWDPVFHLDKISYVENDKVTVTITDPDANFDSDIEDTLASIRVFSTADAVGQIFSARETGQDTGTFILPFTLSDSSSGGQITAYNGNEVTIQYTDQFPADYVDRARSKDFHFSFGIGNTGVNATTVISPTLRNTRGGALEEAFVGSQIVVSTTIQNNNNRDQPFTAFIEIRNHNDVTELLQWQTGVLSESGSTRIGISWVPSMPGNYTARTFVVQDISEPNILSPLAQADIAIKSWDPEFNSESPWYSEGGMGTIRIYDPDANRDPQQIDIIEEIKVYSDSDPAYKLFSATEDAPNSGSFVLTFQLANERSYNTVQARQGGEVIVEYTDLFPADYFDRVTNGMPGEKTFSFAVEIGKPAIYNIRIEPSIKDLQGNDVNSVELGTELQLFVLLTNTNNKTQPYTAVVQVVGWRDRIPVFFELQSGTLEPLGQANFTLSWIPEDITSGFYSFRTFAYEEIDGVPVFLSTARNVNVEILQKAQQ